jgi:cytochrome P450
MTSIDVSSMDLSKVDFGTDPLAGEELHAVLASLRESQRVAPVRFHGGDALLFTRFEDVHEAFRDDQKFPGGDFYESAIEPVVGRTFISMNGREHDVHRKLATPAFRSRAVSRFDEEALVPLAHEVADKFADWGHADLVAELTTVLPFAAITRKLGVPRRADQQMREWADLMLSYPSDPDGAVAAANEFSETLGPLLEERRGNPGDDLLSELAATELGGETLSDDEICATVRLLFAVGATTTSHAMANMLWALLERPELLDRARQEESLRAGIVHELLRWEGPLPTLPRLAAKDARHAGANIPAGTIMLFGLASANRDPRVYGEDPDTFDPDRAPGDILTFGFGPKFCPGSHLARRELLTALTVVLERLPGLRLSDPDGSEPRGGVLRHPDALHCAWDVV